MNKDKRARRTRVVSALLCSAHVRTWGPRLVQVFEVQVRHLRQRSRRHLSRRGNLGDALRRQRELMCYRERARVRVRARVRWVGEEGWR